jgi:uroporphyrinogen-III decarboxylase
MSVPVDITAHGQPFADDARAARIASWSAAEGVSFPSAGARATYRQNVQRLCDAIELKKAPDRVPTMINCTFMPANLYGVAPYDMMYDVDVLTSTVKRFLVDYGAEYYFTPAIIGSGQVFERLDCRQLAWPGHGVAKESGYQYIEGEYMADEDYRALINDPSDFWLRRYLPRACAALEPLSRIPPFTDLWEIVLLSGHMIAFGAQDVQAALRALLEAGTIAREWGEKIVRFDAEVTAMGFVSSAGSLSKAPFDIVADTLRGTRAAMLDMRRRPQLLLEAIDRLTPLAVRQGVAGADQTGNPIVFMPLHKGADGFMSDEQFRTFYWPSLRAVVHGLVAEGCIPFLFCEGGYDTRLEYLKEVPPGSTFCLFDRTDMVRAKEILGGRVCIGGNVPASLILTGTPDEVRSYCKGLLDNVAPGGGYIMAFGTAMDEGVPENVRAMVEFTREYGVYK